MGARQRKKQGFPTHLCEPGFLGNVLLLRRGSTPRPPACCQHQSSKWSPANHSRFPFSLFKLTSFSPSSALRNKVCGWFSLSAGSYCLTRGGKTPGSHSVLLSSSWALTAAVALFPITYSTVGLHMSQGVKCPQCNRVRLPSSQQVPGILPRDLCSWR